MNNKSDISEVMGKPLVDAAKASKSIDKSSEDFYKERNKEFLRLLAENEDIQDQLIAQYIEEENKFFQKLLAIYREKHGTSVKPGVEYSFDIDTLREQEMMPSGLQKILDMLKENK